MSAAPFSFGFVGICRIVNGVLLLDCGEGGTIPVLNQASLKVVMQMASVKADTDLSGERMIVTCEFPNVFMENKQ